MRSSLKRLLGLVAIAAVLCLVAAWQLRSRAPDFWGYGKLGVSSGTPKSAAYYLEVRGVGAQPTIARLVRFSDQSDAPKNALDVSHGVSSEFDSHTQNLDRWNRHFILVAGRTNDEKVVIKLDAPLARTLFARPGTQFGSYQAFEKLWSGHVASHIPSDNGVRY